MSTDANSRATLSIVIPTRDRVAILAQTLDAVEEARGTADEIVVVDDGSTTAARASVRDLTSEIKGCRLVPIEPSGPAAARNRGIEVSLGDRILLLGDDTPPAAGALEVHADPIHRSVGLQGRIDWAPDEEITPVMRFLAPAGPQFYFAGLRDGQELEYATVLGSNLSAPRDWFIDEPFDEGFPDACFEDTELAYRWGRRGRRVHWSERARCLHRHHYPDLEPFLRRQVRAGRSARLAVRRHPQMAWRVVLQPTAVGALFAVRTTARRLAGRGRAEDRWDLACRWAFLRGFLSSSRPEEAAS